MPDQELVPAPAPVTNVNVAPASPTKGASPTLVTLIVGGILLVVMLIGQFRTPTVEPPKPINPDVKPIEPSDKLPVAVSFKVNEDGEWLQVTDKGVHCQVGDMIDFRAKTIGKSITWDSCSEQKMQVKWFNETATFFAAKAGRYKIGAATAIKDAATKNFWVVILVGDPEPEPPPPDARVFVPAVVGLDVKAAVGAVEKVGLRAEPDAATGKVEFQNPQAGAAVAKGSAVKLVVKKDEPKPPPLPTGFRVIFVREATDGAGKLTKEQLNIWNSTKIADYLARKTVKDEKGNHSFRKWDKDINYATEGLALRQLWEASKGKLGQLPVVIIATDQQAVIEPLDGTEAEMLAILQKYGGQ